MTHPTLHTPPARTRIPFRDSLAIGRLRAERMTHLAGRSAAGKWLWPWFLGLMLVGQFGSKPRIHRTADANMTLRGDDTTGETLHPAAVALGVLLYIPQVLALAQLLFIVLIWVISLWLPGFSSNPGDAAVPTVIALGLALPLNLLLSARLAVAVLGQSRRVWQLRAAGEAVCVMTDYVRTATSAKGAGAVMARPVITDLGQRRVIIVGIAANQSLVDHYLALGAVHDTPDGKPGWHRRMRFDYPDRETAY